MAKNIKITGVSPNRTYTKKYETFRGVDFSKDASMVDDFHSPHAPNIIADSGGFPEKRLGWRTVGRFDARINGIFGFGDGESACTIVHSGTKIYKLCGGECEELLDGIADNISTAKYFKGKLCILTGNEFLVFDGERCFRAREAEDMYAPITLMSRGSIKLSSGNLSSDSTFISWDTYGTFRGSDGDDVAYGSVPGNVAINLVSGKRKNHFEKAKSGVMLFPLDSTIDSGTRITMRCISTGEMIFDVMFAPSEGSSQINYSVGKVTDEEVNRECLTTMDISASHLQVYCTIGNSRKNNCGYVVCNINTIKLSGYHHIDGVDDFSIEFEHEVEGYPERINKCTVVDVFENRLFFSGNPDYPNADWYSGVNDPLFVADINYTEIGTDSSAIMGYLRTGDSQAILKSDGDDATVFMRSYAQNSDGTAIFPVKQGMSGLGAIAKGSVCTFLDDPLFLTRNGVYAIAMQDISNERALNVRSTRINNKLLGEQALADAVMCEWNGYLILCIGGNAYVADAASKELVHNKTGTFEYEWYFWNNIPARVMHEDDGELFFGTEDGRVCKFNSDMTNERGEISAAAYSDDGEAIVSEWATNLSYDGDFMQEKTLVKTGSGVMLKSYNRSGVSVLIRTERDFGREVKSASAGIFNFEDIDFSEFTFNTSPYCVVPFNSRVKKYGAIQVICRNAKLNHAFGICGIVRRYFYGKTKK